MKGSTLGSSARPGSAPWANWVIPSLADVVFAGLLVYVLALRTRQLLNTDGDLGRHLTMGHQILASGVVPATDWFSHTRSGEPFVPKEWLGQVIFALVHQQLGLQGVAVLSAVLVALPFLLLTRWMIRDGSNFFVVLALVPMGVLATVFHWLARPHLFTILLALLWTRILARHRSTRSVRWLIPLPMLMVLWVNLHGGFLVGFALLGIYLLADIVDQVGARHERGESSAGSPETGKASFSVATGWLSVSSPGRIGFSPAQSTWHLLGIGAISLVAVGVNPAGYAVLSHVLGFFRSRLLVDNLVEWLSPDFHGFGPQLLLSLVLVAMVSLAAIPRRVDPADLAMLAVWFSFSLSSMRNIPIFVATCLPIVARLATEALAVVVQGRGSRTQNPELRTVPRSLAARLGAADRRLGRPLLPVLCVVAAVLVSAGALGDVRIRAEFDPAVFPVQALPRAEEVGARGNLFNALTWGGYIVYAGYPTHRVFIDGQLDFYGEELTRDYLKVVRLEPDWQETLDRYQIGWVLFSHRSPLSLLLARSPDWRLAHEDATADIFVRVHRPGP